jgi:hypothetical protein
MAGGPPPDPVTLRLSASPGVQFSAAASSTGWLTVSPTSGVMPADVKVTANPANLGPGVYTGTITITASGTRNSPQTVSVTLKIDTIDRIRVVQRMMTKQAPPSSGCPALTPSTSFLPTDPRAYLWFQVEGAATGDRFRVEWVAPDRTTDPGFESLPLWPGLGPCYWRELEIAGKPAASKLGTWTVKVYWNGVPLFTLSFDIKTPVTVVHKMLTRDPLSSTSCAVPIPATSFSSLEAQAWLWFQLSGAQPGARVMAVWQTPDRATYESYAWEVPASGGDRCYLLALDIKGRRPAQQAGTWHAAVYYREDLILTLPFTITGDLLLETSLTARAVSLAAGCPEPDPVTAFARTDSRAWVWFQVSRAKAGDRAAIEYYSPAGQLQHTVKWDPLEKAGNWCYRGAMNIAGTTAAAMFGDWQARIRWNDEVISTLPFQIQPIVIVGSLTAKSVPAGSCPTPPEATSAFRPSDELVWFWLYIRGGLTGDRPREEWYDPSGRLVQSTVGTPMTAAGGWCHWRSLRLAGTAAAASLGVWNISVFWNDEFLLTQQFTLTQPPEPGSGAVPRAERPSTPLREGP